MTDSGSDLPPERIAEERPSVEPAEPAAPVEPAGRTEPVEIPRTRSSRAFTSLIAFAIVLILLLVFILENTKSARIAYFGQGFHMPLGVALLLAAIAGALLAALVGGARIVQLRRHMRRLR